MNTIKETVLSTIKSLEGQIEYCSLAVLDETLKEWSIKEYMKTKDSLKIELAVLQEHVKNNPEIFA